jgi:hypothetical protein
MFRPAVFKRRVKLRAAEVGSNVRDTLERRARALLEGLCGREGFVRPGTVHLLDVSPGHLSTIDMGRHYEYALVLRAEVCNPAPGLQFSALVRETNNFGVLAEGGYFDESGTLVPVIEVVLVRDTVIAKNEVDVTKLKPGDEVGVELLGKRFELRDRRISAFGRAVAKVRTVDPAAAVAAGVAATTAAVAAAATDFEDDISEDDGETNDEDRKTVDLASDGEEEEEEEGVDEEADADEAVNATDNDAVDGEEVDEDGDAFNEDVDDIDEEPDAADDDGDSAKF